MLQYTYSNYSISLDNHDTFIIIKIINNIGNYFFEKKITSENISTFTLDRYISLVKNCLSNKTGYTIEFNEYENKIDMITKYEIEILDISEKITLNKFIENDIEKLQEQNKIMFEKIKELENQNSKLDNTIRRMEQYRLEMCKEILESRVQISKLDNTIRRLHK